MFISELRKTIKNYSNEDMEDIVVEMYKKFLKVRKKTTI